jgi:predicted RecB family nuclease
MIITQNLFSSFIRCKVKASLEIIGKEPCVNEYHNWEVSKVNDYAQKCLNLLQTNKNFLSRISGKSNIHCNKLFIDNQITSINCSSKISGISFENVHKNYCGRYILFRFIPTDKILTTDKLILGFDTVIANSALPTKVLAAQIIYGNSFKISNIAISKYFNQINNIVSEIQSTSHDIAKHQIQLTAKCHECGYYAHCYSIAKDKELLCLLPSMKPKEQQKENKKGIFTVTQLSYTFRPRRNRQHINFSPPKYYHSLKALAIRENKIYVAEKPSLDTIDNPVFIDVEGIQDNNFYYLIGLWFHKEGKYRKTSFWANNISDEPSMWNNFVDFISNMDNPRLMHYGHYETVFFKRMLKKYPPQTVTPYKFSLLIEKAINVLSIIYGRIYFPTYSNGLKEIARYLGFSWAIPDVSNLSSILWRNRWEESKNPVFKSNLLSYNVDDCRALSVIFENIKRLASNAPPTDQNVDADQKIIYTDTLKREKPYRFGRNEFYFPQLETINKAAYWDYQRDKIFFRNKNRIINRPVKNKHKISQYKTNSIFNSEPLSHCPFCSSSRIDKHAKINRVIKDLKFTSMGIKRNIFEYQIQRYRCRNCGKTFQGTPSWGAGKQFGLNLKAFSIYQHIEIKVPTESLVESINQLFKLDLTRTSINGFKSEYSHYYKPTYSSILDGLIKGKVIHIDETKISVQGNINYIWVLANFQNVYYYYTETREGDFLKPLLQEFHGVLISDFYTAYESIECPQQKCLIHLIRDFNDDLFKNPFNEKFKELVSDFSVLLSPIIDSIHRYGLQSYHLKKFKPSINMFFNSLLKNHDNNELFQKYRKRLLKNKDVLFTFINFDNIPWNNNNAEHAVKAFAILRKTINGVTTKNGIQDYLVLLSILQTCKYRQINFLDFLRSREIDLNNFPNKNHRSFQYI